jgi:isopentenyl diphosphate isomerase/L-lactate dehydrogenase-like FMN-dependent dehydrogenase
LLYEYAEGGSYGELTLQRNVTDLAQVQLRQRVLQGRGEIDLKTTLFGQEFALPIILGPVGIAEMYQRNQSGHSDSRATMISAARVRCAVLGDYYKAG